MPMFSGKSEEEKEQREAAKRQEKEQQEAAKQAAKAEKERATRKKQFLTTPLGQAAQAFEAGDGFFQLESSALAVKRGAWDPDGSVSQQRRDLPADALSQVESAGWRLEHVSHVYVMTNQRSRDKFTSSGQEVGIEGEVIGYYIFRRDETRRHPELQNRTLEEMAQKWRPTD